ncbi:hypothetical protein [Absidia glauca]|uniref:Uncharacterized protein n=1 Tax=Absidia glauca TaxID=4829 RepID=A0A163TGQ0_ABSGL|nr:hypothetical protein [Absidia glauca]
MNHRRTTDKLVDIAATTFTEGLGYNRRLSEAAIGLLQTVASHPGHKDQQPSTSTTSRETTNTSSSSISSQTQQNRNSENGPFSFPHLLHFIGITIPVSTILSWMPRNDFTKEIRDIAHELEDSARHTIHHILSGLSPTHSRTKFHDLPSDVQAWACHFFHTQIADLRLNTDSPRNCAFINGLLADRWNMVVGIMNERPQPFPSVSSDDPSSCTI